MNDLIPGSLYQFYNPYNSFDDYLMFENACGVGVIDIKSNDIVMYVKREGNFSMFLYKGRMAYDPINWKPRFFEQFKIVKT